MKKVFIYLCIFIVLMFSSCVSKDEIYFLKTYVTNINEQYSKVEIDFSYSKKNYVVVDLKGNNSECYIKIRHAGKKSDSSYRFKMDRSIEKIYINNNLVWVKKYFFLPASNDWSLDQYELIDVVEVKNSYYTIVVETSGFREKVRIVKIYKGDLQKAYNHEEKIEYYYPEIEEYIDDENKVLQSIQFDKVNLQLIIEYTNGEKNIVDCEGKLE
ncbi:MAG: hypothetical protein KBT21_11095 [Treponema sp.]|nr:hypothetical protein [Candidatus Treponema merdequi]